MNDFIEAKHLVSEALKIPVKNLLDSDKYNSLPEWDSLGQLNIIITLENYIGSSICNEEFEKLNSIETIAIFLEEKRR